MKKILIAYTTLSGSTVEVAQAVGEEIAGAEQQVDVLPVEKVNNLAAYDAVVLGAPMIVGWHRSALAFLKKNRKDLKNKPLAVFATAMSLTSMGETEVSGVPVCVDPILAKPPQNPQRLTLKENYASIVHYASPILKAAGSNQPVSMAFFGGRLDYSRLKPLPMLFVMLVIRVQPGDRRNWQAIRSWAGSLPPLFGSNNPAK